MREVFRAKNKEELSKNANPVQMLLPYLKQCSRITIFMLVFAFSGQIILFLLKIISVC
tara:strand:- start:19408 stop:19581 length:174 start_codon:yes stop_codon:yes gene_type:complete